MTNLGVVRDNPDQVQSWLGSDFVAQSPETLVYDGDGNLVRDGGRVYSSHVENRLVGVMSYGATDRASWRRVDWAYDILGRRIWQTSYMLSNWVWVMTEDLKFVSDPMLFGRHIVELNFTNNTLVRTYVWGLDLSRTMDGAGGVGGLLWVNQHTGSSAGAYFCTYDGNGNVVALVSANTGAETARYGYGPFTEPIRATGPMAKENPFRFSTKRTCNTTDLVLYEYRAYSPSLGRWVSRDPIGEWAGATLYAFVGNTPVGKADLLGLVTKNIFGFTIVIEGEWSKPATIYRKVPGSESENCTCRDIESIWRISGAVQINVTILDTGIKANIGIEREIKAVVPPKEAVWLEVKVEVKTLPPAIEVAGI